MGACMRLKHYEIVTDADKLTVDIQAVCMKYKTIKQWAYILHDKDDTRPHYHIYVNFGNSGVESSEVAKWFEVSENFIEKIKGRKTDMLLYLTHGQENQKHKHQYSPDEVIANFSFEIEIEKSKILGNFEKYSYAEMLAYVNTLPIGDKPSAFSKLESLWKLQCKTLTLQTDRQLEVVFIYGRGGTGKTYYAKKLLKKLGFDYCVSSSSNDPFQDYLGQKAIILDDLRDRVFKSFEDLLKILDNNTMSSVSSRFNNKVFNGEMIVITSSVPLRYWYKGKNADGNYFNVSLEDLNQLYRRVGTYIEMTTDEIIVFDEGVGVDGNPIGLGRVFKNEIPKIVEVKKKKVDILSIFDSMCDDINYFDEPRQLKMNLKKL